MKKKYIKSLLTFMLFAFAFSALLYVNAGAECSINISNVAKGYVTVKYTDGSKERIKVQVVKGDENYTYDITGMSSTKIPLQMGKGKYSVYILENISGTKYRPLTSETFDVPAVSNKDLYTISIPMINFDASKTAIKDISDILKKKANDESKAKSLYNKLVQEWVYDFEKLKNDEPNYVPVIDTLYKSKKGICYDYSSVIAGGLRKSGVPTRLVMGYASYVDVYHAWNEILINGKWIIVDATADSQYYKAKQSYKFAKNAKEFKVVKIF